MIGGQHDHEIVAPHAIGEPLQEPAEIVVEAQHLIVDLAGVRAVRVTDGISRGQADCEHVGAPASAAEPQRLEALEREQQRERIHGGDASDRRGGANAVGGQPVGENHVRPPVFPNLIVRFPVGAVRKQQRPRRAGRLEGQPPGVERLHPGGQRVGVVAARGEQTRLIPEHLLFRLTERENRAPILAADR